MGRSIFSERHCAPAGMGVTVHQDHRAQDGLPGKAWKFTDKAHELPVHKCVSDVLDDKVTGN
jgi:hypothetical protein